MGYRSELAKIAAEIEKLLSDRFSSGKEDEFRARKREVLNIMKILFGEASREYRVVKLSALPGTTLKVVNHVLARPVNDIDQYSGVAVNR